MRVWTRALNLSLRILALCLAIGLTAAAVHDVSRAWDVWAYHMPFAARIMDIVPSDLYRFSDGNEARFAGFPLLGETLQGLAWRLTGRPESTNLVALLSLCALIALLRGAFEVPLHIGFLALVAVPLVMIHARASYVDLPASAFATMMLLLAYRAVRNSTPAGVPEILVASALGALAVNIKLQVAPVVVFAWSTIAVCAARGCGRGTRLLVCAAMLPVVLATPLKNAIVHGNPVYPIAVTALGRSLPHAEPEYTSSPHWLADASRPKKFAASVLEFGVPPVSSGRRWTIDQWTPEDDPGFRMGGFFNLYVVVNLAALAWLVVRHPSRETGSAAALVASVTAITCVLPQSHELRYYMYWMLFLVGLNAILWSRRAPLAAAAVAVCALAVVLRETRGIYVFPSGQSFAELLASEVDTTVVAHVPTGGTICLARPPWTFLYASTFHDRLYTVHEASREQDCEGSSLVPERP